MGEINVAIADDNERILDLLDEIISSYKELRLVGKSNNGEDMYQLIKEKQPDVVLLDLIMPKMDGLSVMEMIGNDKELKKHPDFIVVTAVGQERITQDTFKRGASYYIIKHLNNYICEVWRKSYEKNTICSVRISTFYKNGWACGCSWFSAQIFQ